MISAKIIADSISPAGERCTSFILKFPRIVLAEFNTHRMISKNSASSRAIPFKKMCDLVMNEPFIPLKFMKEHKGMQGTEYFSPEEEISLKIGWMGSRDSAVAHARMLSEAGVTKQICNRILEPYMYHTVIATGTDWGNFFALRAHDQAEIHIQDLAYKMLKEYNESSPKKLAKGEWHIPFGEKFDLQKILDIFQPINSHEFEMLKVKIATARCARVSYLNFEGKDDYESDVKLHDSLLESGHMSPFEHCAEVNVEGWYSGNYKGFKQYRKIFQNENRVDPRVEIKQ